MNHGSKRQLSRCHGVTSLEYVILVGLIAVAVAGALTEFEVEVPQFFQKVAYSLGAAPGPGDGSGNDPGTGNPGGGSPGGGTPGDGTPGDGTPGDGGDPGTGDPGSGDPGSGGGDGGSGDDGGADEGSPGDGSGAPEDGSFKPDFIESMVFNFDMGTVESPWFVTPAGIPPEDWRDKPYTFESDGDIVISSGKLDSKPPLMGWEGVRFTLTVPAPGETLEARLTIGTHKVLYRFTRKLQFQ